MNATLRTEARTLVCSISAPALSACPRARTLPTPCPAVAARPLSADAETDALIARLADTLIASFTLTEWERQVLHLALFGRSCSVIADRLGIRETTVHKHMHRIFAETKTDGRTALYNLGLRLTAQRAILGSMRLAA